MENARGIDTITPGIDTTLAKQIGQTSRSSSIDTNMEEYRYQKGSIDTGGIQYRYHEEQAKLTKLPATPVSIQDGVSIDTQELVSIQYSKGIDTRGEQTRLKSHQKIQYRYWKHGVSIQHHQYRYWSDVVSILGCFQTF